MEQGITCPNCGGSSNNFGIFLGHSSIRCTHCGFDYNHKTGELSYRGDTIRNPRHSPKDLEKLIEMVKETLK